MIEPRDASASALPEGYTDLPPGKIASVVTFLEMTQAPAPRGPARDDLTLERLTGADQARYRAVYRTLGERWVWFSRLSMADGALEALLDDPAILAFACRRDGRDVGLVEIDLRREGEAEIVYFGVIEEAIGTGVGRWMMDRAIAAAFARPLRRLWLHTCTFDHPRAVAFYRSCGFRPYKFAVEVTNDPRLTGALPRDSQPDWPPVVG